MNNGHNGYVVSVIHTVTIDTMLNNNWLKTLPVNKTLDVFDTFIIILVQYQIWRNTK